MANGPALTQEDFDALAEYLAECGKDPVKFVKISFPWGEANTLLEHKRGPEKWQLEVLEKLRDGLLTADEAIRIATASGHGVGKSALVAWIILWAIGTHEDTRGVVTANTDTQLRTKTWAEVAKWYHMWLAKDLFTITATSIFANDPGHEKTWRIDAIPWSPTNPEAFAGLHNQGNRILVVFDEASAIEPIIWEVIEGAFTDADTEKIWVCFGNPTRPNGRFYDCFHRFRDIWHRWQVDSRTVSFSDKQLIAEWAKLYGEDSDFFKVRVRGVFPSGSDKQFISSALVEEARHRQLEEYQYNFAAKIIGVDPAWRGGDQTVAFLRQGLYCKRLLTLPKNDNDVVTAGIIARLEDEYKADAVFIDLGYGQGIKSAGDYWGRHWTLVAFSQQKGVRLDCYNKRAEMWVKMREWLINGGMLPWDDQELADDLTAPEVRPTDDGVILLESKEHMKERGVHSPDAADALALTFAYDVRSKMQEEVYNEFTQNEEYDPFRDM